MKKYFLIAIITLFSGVGYAQNPVTPPGVYLSDPSAREWKDGKLYIYGSRDEEPGAFCSQSYDVLSSSDLTNWTVSPNAFSTTNPFMRLWAPDCMYKNGTYYLYYCQWDQSENVATSKTPNGPFMNGTQINLYGHNQIDPCIFTDDDGQSYYIWGQFHAYVAKLQNNMTEIDPKTIRDSVITEKEHHFHEGGSMVKRNGIYYMVYTDISRAGLPTCLGYATAKSPYGPFKYQGIIIDNTHCDPRNWNNHGCLVKFKDKWYVLYHRASQNSYSMRRACMEPVIFRKDGTIPEVEMTTQGAALPLSATNTLLAGSACLVLGSVYINADTLTHIKNDDKVVYKYLDFRNGADSVMIKVLPGQHPGTISVATDQLWHEPVATIHVPANEGNSHDWVTITAPLTAKVNGVHELVLRFDGEGSDLFQVATIQFK